MEWDKMEEDVDQATVLATTPYDNMMGFQALVCNAIAILICLNDSTPGITASVVDMIWIITAIAVHGIYEDQLITIPSLWPMRTPFWVSLWDTQKTINLDILSSTKIPWDGRVHIFRT